MCSIFRHSIVVSIAFLLMQGCYWPKNELLSKKNLRVGLDTHIKSFDPFYATDANSQYLESLLHCSLFRYDHKGVLRLDMAKGYYWDQNNTQLVVSIKRESPLNAVEIAGYFHKLKKDKKAPRQYAFKNLSKVISTGNAVLFELYKTDPAFIHNLSIGIALNDNSKTCGAYSIKSVESQRVVLQANKPSDVFFDKITFYVIKDIRTRITKLMKGEIDIIPSGVPYDLASNLEQSPDIDIVTSRAINVTYLGLNFHSKTIQSKKFRDFLNQSINRSDIVKYLYHDFASKADSFIPNEDHRTSAESRSEPIQGHDNDKFTIHVTSDPFRTLLARSIAQQLRNAGLDVEVKSFEWGKFKKDVDGGLAQAWLMKWTGYKDLDIIDYALNSKNIPPFGANRGHYNNYELDQLLDKANTTVGSDREKILGQANSLIAQDLPYIFLFHEHHVVAIKKDIMNYTVFADGRWDGVLGAYRK